MTEAHQGMPAALIDLHVVAAIIFLDGKIMAVKRVAGGPSGLKWEFPGGKVEHGEQTDAALMREIEEELGMAITVREELGTYVTPLGKWTSACIASSAKQSPLREGLKHTQRFDGVAKRSCVPSTGRCLISRRSMRY